MQQSKCFLCGPIPGYITGSTLKMSDVSFGDFDFNYFAFGDFGFVLEDT
jgi:hypothetical protein